MSSYYNQGVQVIIGNGQNFPGTPRISLIPFIQNAYDKGLLNFTVLPPGSISLAEIQDISTAKILGRSTAGSGVIEQISIGTGLSLSGGTLSSTVTATPGGSDTQIQYNNAGVFGGSSQLIFNGGATNTLDITGSGNNSSTNSFRIRNSDLTQILSLQNNGELNIRDKITIGYGGSHFNELRGGPVFQIVNSTSGGALTTDGITMDTTHNVGISNTGAISARLDIQGSGATSATNALRVRNSAGTQLLAVRNDGNVAYTNASVTSSSANDGILGITGFTHTANSGSTNALWGLNIDGTQVFNTANQTSGGLRIKLSNNATSSQYNTPLYIESNAAADAVNFIKNTSSTGGSSIRLISGSAETSMTLIQSPNTNPSSISEGNGITIRTASTSSSLGVRSNALTLTNSTTSGNPQSVNCTFFIMDKRIGVGQYAPNTPNATLDIKGEGATSSTNALYIRNSANTNFLTVRDDGFVNILTNTEVSKPSVLLSGTGYSGGTSTTTKPTFLIEPTGTTSTGWNTSGTKFGINAESGFTGMYLDLQLNGSSQTSFVGQSILFNNITGIKNVIGTGLEIGQVASTGGSGFDIKFVDGNGANRYAKFTATGSIIGTSNNPSKQTNAHFQLDNTAKGFLPPRLTTAQRDAVSWVAGDAGMMIFNTTLVKLQVWNGAAWETITSV